MTEPQVGDATIVLGSFGIVYSPKKEWESGHETYIVVFEIMAADRSGFMYQRVTKQAVVAGMLAIKQFAMPIEFRADGWPLCPICGEDELFAAALNNIITGCYRCQWQPPYGNVVYTRRAS